MLAQLDQIDGVERSFTNGSGTLLWLSLRPGAKPAKIAGDVRRVLSAQVEDRTVVQLPQGAVPAALRREAWRDGSQVAEPPAAEARAAEPRPPKRRGLLAVLLGCAAIGLGLFWWRQRKTAAAERERGLPA